MFIYLNRTGYNGLFRVNSKGMFNVPPGAYDNPGICDATNLERVSTTLSQLDVEIEHLSFLQMLGAAEAGDFVYFDPPYAPLSTTAQFTSYTAAGFTGNDQQQLQREMIRLAEKQCYVLLSNSAAPEIRALYDENPDARRVRLEAHLVPARRAINSNASRRGYVEEYIITNLPERST